MLTLTVNLKKAKVAVLILNKADFRTRKITWFKDKNYIMIKGNIFQGGNITMFNLYVPNNRVS